MKYFDVSGGPTITTGSERKLRQETVITLTFDSFLPPHVERLLQELLAEAVSRASSEHELTPWDVPKIPLLRKSVEV